MQTSAAPGVAPPGIFTTQFWLLSLSSFLFFASFNMLIPELPAYLTSMGGAEHKGLIISNRTTGKETRVFMIFGLCLFVFFLVGSHDSTPSFDTIA